MKLVCIRSTHGDRLLVRTLFRRCPDFTKIHSRVKLILAILSKQFSEDWLPAQPVSAIGLGQRNNAVNAGNLLSSLNLLETLMD
jgi:hypothetical protein